jgi:hypothetical protein
MRQSLVNACIGYMVPIAMGWVTLWCTEDEREKGIHTRPSLERSSWTSLKLHLSFGMVTLGCLLSTPKAGLQRFSNEDTGKIVRSSVGGHQASSTPGNGWPGGSRTTRVDTRPALGAVIKGGQLLPTSITLNNACYDKSHTLETLRSSCCSPPNPSPSPRCRRKCHCGGTVAGSTAIMHAEICQLQH